MTEHPDLKHYDVVIAGGGVIGASCAYQLSKRKHLKVALIVANRPGNATRASAGGLWAIGESVGQGCGVTFFRMLSANRKPQAPGTCRPQQLCVGKELVRPCRFRWSAGPSKK